jgi:hypothetical protein
MSVKSARRKKIFPPGNVRMVLPLFGMAILKFFWLGVLPGQNSQRDIDPINFHWLKMMKCLGALQIIR